MFPAAFDYRRAGSVDEALKLLAEHGDAKLLAGGHSLLPMMKLRLAQPSMLIDIGRCAELRGIQRTDGGVRVGALTTHAEVSGDATVAEVCPLVSEAAGQIGDPQVRNRGTVGGNIAHADPASDLPAVFVASGATVLLRGADGERRVAAGDFFVDLLTTDLRPGEVLLGVEVPAAGAGSGSCYRKVEHPASGYAVCGAAAIVRLEGGRCVEARLAFNGITATPLVADLSSLEGGSLDDAAIGAAMAGLAPDDPLSDVHASGDYRAHLARVYGARALREARQRAAG